MIGVKVPEQSAGQRGELPVGSRQRLLDYLRQWTGDPDLADDLVQETTVRWWNQLPDDVRDVDAWLFRVATNLARDAMRSESRRGGLREREQGTLLPAAPPSPDEVVESREVQQIVRTALDKLTPQYRTALLMRHQGFKHREIGEALGIQTNAVGVVIGRAVKKLAGLLPPKEVLQ